VFNQLALSRTLDRFLISNKNMQMRRFILIAMVLSLSVIPALAQMQGRGPGQMRPGDNVAGKVTAVAADPPR